MNLSNHIYLTLSLSIVIAVSACQPRSGSTDVDVDATRSQTANTAIAQPSIRVASATEGEDGYRLVSGDSFDLNVQAPGATEVELFYQPVTADDRALMLDTLRNPSQGGEFAVNVRIPQDLNGEVWARVKYPSGEIKETEHLMLAARSELENNTTASEQKPSPSPTNGQEAPTDTHESARSDKLTGGRLERTSLKKGNGNIRITINVPAFKMTLWQGDKEVKLNYVGVGRKDFPIPVGMRSADKIILNPDWIPPNSAWVRRSSNVEPYERVPADDPDNPLGNIKIPLGNAYLLHEAQGPADIGNLVSHGCVRVMSDDLFEVTKMIARARALSISEDEIASARKGNERRVIDLGEELPVDINYDTMVVENGILTIYPDVYERDMNTIEKLRAELQQYDVDTSKMDDAALKQMLDKVTSDQKFVVALADLNKGNAVPGKVEPLIPQNAVGTAKRPNNG